MFASALKSSFVSLNERGKTQRVDDINTLLWEKLNEARDDAYDELHTRYVPASYHYKVER